jgi:hypothetical protein
MVSITEVDVVFESSMARQEEVWRRRKEVDREKKERLAIFGDLMHL